MVEAVKNVWGTLTGKVKGATGPSDADKAAQVEAANRAATQRAEAERLASLSTTAASRRRTLSYAKDRLGG